METRLWALGYEWGVIIRHWINENKQCDISRYEKWGREGHDMTWHDMTARIHSKGWWPEVGDYDRMTLSKLYRARTERCYIKGVPAIWRCTGHGCHALFTLQYLLTLVRSGGEDLADGLMPIEPDGPLALPSLVLKWLVLLSPLAPWFPLSVQDGLN